MIRPKIYSALLEISIGCGMEELNSIKQLLISKNYSDKITALIQLHGILDKIPDGERLRGERLKAIDSLINADICKYLLETITSDFNLMKLTFKVLLFISENKVFTIYSTIIMEAYTRGCILMVLQENIIEKNISDVLSFVVIIIKRYMGSGGLKLNFSIEFLFFIG